MHVLSYDCWCLLKQIRRGNSSISLVKCAWIPYIAPWEALSRCGQTSYRKTIAVAILDLARMNNSQQVWEKTIFISIGEGLWIALLKLKMQPSHTTSFFRRKISLVCFWDHSCPVALLPRCCYLMLCYFLHKHHLVINLPPWIRVIFPIAIWTVQNRDQRFCI